MSNARSTSTVHPTQRRGRVGCDALKFLLCRRSEQVDRDCDRLGRVFLGDVELDFGHLGSVGHMLETDDLPAPGRGIGVIM